MAVRLVRYLFRSSKTGPAPDEKRAVGNAQEDSEIGVQDLQAREETKPTADQCTSTSWMPRKDDDLKSDIDRHFQDIGLKDIELATLRAEVVKMKAKQYELEGKLDEQKVKLAHAHQTNRDLRRKLSSSNKKIEFMRPAMAVARDLGDVAKRATQLHMDFPPSTSETDVGGDDEMSDAEL